MNISVIVDFDILNRCIDTLTELNDTGHFIQLLMDKTIAYHTRIYTYELLHVSNHDVIIYYSPFLTYPDLRDHTIILCFASCQLSTSGKGK